MDLTPEKKEKYLVTGLFVVLTLLPVLAFVGLCVTIVVWQTNFLSWME